MVERLIGLASNANSDSSLFVYNENEIAYQFYQRLGFERFPMPKNRNNSEGITFMKRLNLI